MATELGKAYVQIVPSAQGISGSISGVLGGEAEKAGKSSGDKAGNSLVSSFKSAIITLGIGKVITDAVSDTGNFEEVMAKVSTLFTGTGIRLSDCKGDGTQMRCV